MNDESHFDVDAAKKERLEWRLGGKMPTERAAGYQEGLARDVSKKIKDALKDAALKDTEHE